MKKNRLAGTIPVTLILVASFLFIVCRCSATVGDPFTLVGASNAFHGTPGITQGPLGYNYMNSNNKRDFMPADPNFQGNIFSLDADASYNLDDIVAEGYLLPLVLYV